MKAVRLLQSADVVLYDDLVPDAILDLARREAERIAVGKRGYRKSCNQEDISKLIVQMALRGKRVVRLKGGDPAIFGRLAEEMAEVRAAGIASEIVPGITAASGAAASLGISLTHRAAAAGAVHHRPRARRPPARGSRLVGAGRRRCDHGHLHGRAYRREPGCKAAAGRPFRRHAGGPRRVRHAAQRTGSARNAWRPAGARQRDGAGGALPDDHRARRRDGRRPSGYRRNCGAAPAGFHAANIGRPAPLCMDAMRHARDAAHEPYRI